MATLFNADLKPLSPGTSTHSYDHARKLFLSDTFRLSPKQSFSYYVVLNINNNLGTGILSGILSAISQQILPSDTSSQTTIEQYEVGLMAKRADLPKFKLNTRSLNSYNRKNIIQTNIIYDPISITFHDDCADVVLNFWNDYYTYYYRDSDYTESYYNVAHKYQPRLTDSWGFTPRNLSTIPFLKSIQIYSLHKKRFTEYEIINPFISDWRHGEHNSESGNQILESTMTLVYETVKYRTGYINPIDVNGFATLHYDNVQSPISTSITNIYDDNGLLGALTNSTRDLARPDGTSTGANIFNGILNVYKGIQTAKSLNYKSLLSTTIASTGLGILNKAATSIFGSIISVPTVLVGSALVYATSRVLSASKNNINQGIVINNNSAGQENINLPATESQTDQLNYINGAELNVVNYPQNTPIYQTSGNTTDGITVNNFGQPVTTQETSANFDTFGTPIPLNQLYQNNTYGYNQTDPNLNLLNKTPVIQPDGKQITQYFYQNGDIVVKDQNDNTLSFVPGSRQSLQQIPINTRTLADQGVTIDNNGISYYTNPTTNQTYIIGATTARVENNLNTPSENFKLSSQTFSTQNVTLSGTPSVQLSQNGLTNNNFYSFQNSYNGIPLQGIDLSTGDIKSFSASLEQTGGYIPTDPTKNQVSLIQNEDGTLVTYFNGDQVQFDNQGNGVILQTGISLSWLYNLFKNSNINADYIAALPNPNITDVAKIIQNSNSSENLSNKVPNNIFVNKSSVATDWTSDINNTNSGINC